MLDGWSDTHSNWIKMPAGPSLHARSRTAAPLAGCEYIFIKKRQKNPQLMVDFLCPPSYLCYWYQNVCNNDKPEKRCTVFRARFPHLSARKCHRGEHLWNGSLAEAGHTGVLWEEIRSEDITPPHEAEGRIYVARQACILTGIFNKKSIFSFRRPLSPSLSLRRSPSPPAHRASILSPSSIICFESYHLSPLTLSDYPGPAVSLSFPSTTLFPVRPFLAGPALSSLPPHQSPSVPEI